MLDQLEILRVEVVVNLPDFRGGTGILGNQYREATVRLRANDATCGHVLVGNAVGSTYRATDDIVFLKLVTHIKLTFS